MKRFLLTLTLCALVLSGCSKKKTENFALLTGMNKTQVEHIQKHYTTLIVKGTFTKDITTTIKKHTTILYGQINMTANKNQNYQNSNITHKNTTYANITLDAWQKHIKDQINTMKTNGYDGLYIRGFNLYEYSHKDMNTYNVMMHFLEYAHKLDMKVIIQDGHIFIDDFITHKENKDLITGVLREDVYTKYNKKNRTLGQDKIISDEKKAFLDRVVDYGMKAYVVEYTKASDWKAVIEHDAKKRGYNYVIINVVEYTKASDWKAVIEHDAKKRGYNYVIIKHHNKTKE